jgi:large subunit ribosomal protein L10
MNRQQKELVIDLFHKNFSANKGSFFVDYCGLTVVQMQQLRRQIREKGGSLKIAKMRLVRRALHGLDGFDGLVSYCKQQVGVVFAHDESGASDVAKILTDFAKKNKSLGLVAGCVDTELLDKTAILRMASLPSREVLLAQLCGTLKAPLIKFLILVEEIKKQKQAE